MQLEQLIALYDQDQRKDVIYPNMRREVLPGLVRHVNLSGQGEGMITYSRLDATNTADTILDQITFFERLGQSFEWKVYDYDSPADLRERLADAGFVVHEAESIMVLELAEGCELLAHPIPQSISRISDPAGITDVIAVEEAVWNQSYSDLGEYLAGTLATDPASMSVYVAYVAGRPVSAAWTYFPPDSVFASLWGGSTLAAFRRMGFYTAMLAVRAQEALQRGVQFLTVDASPMSRPILERHGFHKIADSYPCKWEIDAKSACDT